MLFSKWNWDVQIYLKNLEFTAIKIATIGDIFLWFTEITNI